MKPRMGKSGRPDLNRGPSAPKTDALTRLRYAPMWVIQHLEESGFRENQTSHLRGHLLNEATVCLRCCFAFHEVLLPDSSRLDQLL